ncbi:MAG TPA: hypothetical protein VGF14_05670 [Alphaproteobacteria bacterium]
MPSDISFSPPILIDHLFAYQKTKRLGLLLDQLSWSLNLDIFHNKKHPDLQVHLQAMVDEARHHVTILADGLKSRHTA